MKILVIQLKRIGDAVVSLPVCSSLRRTFPEARIDYMLYDHVAPLFINHPDIDNIVAVTREERRRPLRYLAKILQLRRTGYEIVLDLKTLPASALTTLFSGAKLRIGFDHPRSRAWVYDVTVPRRVEGMNAVERRLQLLGGLGRPIETVSGFSIYLGDTEVAAMRQRMAAAGVDFDGPVLAFDITSSRPYKTWPLDYFVALMRGCIADYGAQAVLTSGPGERRYVEDAARQVGNAHAVVSGVETTDVRELAALISNCDILIGNDSAPRHIAEAVGVPTLAVFSPRTSKHQWMPTLNALHQGVDLGDALHIQDKNWKKAVSDVNANLEAYYRMITPEVVRERLDSMLPPLLASKVASATPDPHPA